MLSQIKWTYLINFRDVNQRIREQIVDNQSLGNFTKKNGMLKACRFNMYLNLSCSIKSLYKTDI